MPLETDSPAATLGGRDAAWKKRKLTYLVENPVSLLADEAARLVKVQSPELTAPVQLPSDLAADFHDGLEHLVVAVARK